MGHPNRCLVGGGDQGFDARDGHVEEDGLWGLQRLEGRQLLRLVGGGDGLLLLDGVEGCEADGGAVAQVAGDGSEFRGQ